MYMPWFCDTCPAVLVVQDDFKRNSIGCFVITHVYGFVQNKTDVSESILFGGVLSNLDSEMYLISI